jgi:hypothetical protein
MWPLQCKQGFPLTWTIDLVFDPTCLRFELDLTWPRFKLELGIIKTSILTKLYEETFINVTSRMLTSFPLIWPGDLVFDPTWPIFELELGIIKTRILTKFQKDTVINVTSRVLTSFSYDLTWWPNFWPHMTQIWTWARDDQDKHSDQVIWRYNNKCDLKSVNKLFL